MRLPQAALAPIGPSYFQRSELHFTSLHFTSLHFSLLLLALKDDDDDDDDDDEAKRTSLVFMVDLALR